MLRAYLRQEREQNQTSEKSETYDDMPLHSVNRKSPLKTLMRGSDSRRSSLPLAGGNAAEHVLKNIQALGKDLGDTATPLGEDLIQNLSPSTAAALLFCDLPKFLEVSNLLEELAVMITDNDFNVLWVSTALVNLSGFSSAELCDRELDDSLQGPDTNPVVSARIKKALKQRYSSIEEQLVYYRKNLERFLVQISGTSLSNDNVHPELKKREYFLFTLQEIMLIPDQSQQQSVKEAAPVEQEEWLRQEEVLQILQKDQLSRLWEQDRT